MERAAFVLFAANVAFAILSVIGQVGQNVSLPLWLAAAQQNTSGNASGDENADSMGPYFVLSFSSLAFVVVFGLATLISFALFPRRVTREELAFPQWQLFLVGLFDSLNGLFVVYASPPVRTAPFLQAILGNFLIPLTIVFASLIPIMSGDNSDPQDKQAWLQQPIAARVLWPLCFMFGFVPAALMNVFQEKGLKDSRKVNLLYYLFWINLHQLWVTALLFWFDIVPYFGTSNGIQQFGRSYWFSVKCFFGGAGCNSSAGVRGTVFIAMYVLSYVAQGLLIRPQSDVLKFFTCRCARRYNASYPAIQAEETEPFLKEHADSCERSHEACLIQSAAGMSVFLCQCHIGLKNAPVVVVYRFGVIKLESATCNKERCAEKDEVEKEAALLEVSNEENMVAMFGCNGDDVMQG
eukprot:Em0009g413a